MTRSVVLRLVLFLSVAVGACDAPAERSADPPDDAARPEGAASDTMAARGTGGAEGLGSGSTVDGTGRAANGGDAGDGTTDQAGAPAVLFFGTSLTAGLGLDEQDDAFPGVIREKMDSAGFDHRVVNAGVPGETSAAGLRRIGWVLDRTDVGVLVLELGANDGLRGQDPEALRANLRAAIDSIRAHEPDADIVLAGMEAPPNLGPRYTEGFREVFREAARDDDAHLVPFLLEGVAGVPELNQDDRIHPTAEGHRLVADNVWEVLEPVLSERVGGTAGDAP